MSVTKRFVALVALGFVLQALLAFTGFGVFTFVSYNAVLFGCLFLDYFLSPKESAFTLSREGDGLMYFKTANTVAINVTNTHKRPVFIELKDETLLRHFRIVSENLSHTIAAGDELQFSYEVIPSKRGAFTFGHVYVRYTGDWGLCRKYFAANLPMEFKVYPNLSDIGRYRIMLYKNKLLPQGERPVATRGGGTEFESLREYVPGDDYRKINWKATARGIIPVVNTYDIEKNQPVYIMLDTGRAMSYSVGGYKKLDYAINAALILSDIINKKGDNSGLMVFDTDVKTVIMPGKGPEHRNALMEALYHVEDTKNTSDYEGAARELITRQKRRCIAFVFTDFETLVESADLSRALTILKRRHLPVAVIMKSESAEQLAVKNAANVQDIFRKGLAMEYLDKRQSLVKELNKTGITCVECEAERFATEAVNRFLKLKARGGA